MKAEIGQQAQAFLVSLLATLGVNYAAAQECEVDADCGAGYACEVYEDEVCSGKACARGEVCPPPVCESYRRAYCVSARCEADADCPDPMVCHAQLNEVCTDYPTEACPDDGTPCAPVPPKPSSCTTELSQARCVQPYELPCANDADCGGGFRCEEQIIRWCSGSAPSPADGGVVTPPPPPECGEERTGVFGCQLRELPCTTDSECPAGLGCYDNPSRVSCGRPAGSSGGVALDAGSAVTDVADAGAPRSAPGSIVDDVATVPAPGFPSVICDDVPSAPAKLCMPRSWRGNGSAGEDSSTDEDSATEEEPATDPGSVDDSGETDETVAPPSKGGTSKPRGRLLGWLRRALRDGRGCAVSPTESESSFELSWLLLAGALAIPATRRRR